MNSIFSVTIGCLGESGGGSSSLVFQSLKQNFNINKGCFRTDALERQKMIGIKSELFTLTFYDGYNEFVKINEYVNDLISLNNECRNNNYYSLKEETKKELLEKELLKKENEFINLCLKIFLEEKEKETSNFCLFEILNKRNKESYNNGFEKGKLTGKEEIKQKFKDLIFS